MISVVVGGQYGSEGKGKTAHALNGDICVRCGGPNAGHTVNGLVWRQISCPPNKDSVLVTPPGSIISPKILNEEAQRITNRIYIDKNCIVITDNHIMQEKPLVDLISSTGSGTGAALADRVMRNARQITESDLPPNARLVNIPLLLNENKDRSKIVIEGTQGFGLSPFHGEYPYVTSRDTTVSSFLSDCGLAVSDERIVVFRTYPIRVGGNSGPLLHETTWDKIKGKPEYTSVTNKLRRVAEFDYTMYYRACLINQATGISITGLDRLEDDKKFLSLLQRYRYPIKFVSYSPDTIEKLK